jgi:hypothetical protein
MNTSVEKGGVFFFPITVFSFKESLVFLDGHSDNSLWSGDEIPKYRLIHWTLDFLSKASVM